MRRSKFHWVLFFNGDLSIYSSFFNGDLSIGFWEMYLYRFQRARGGSACAKLPSSTCNVALPPHTRQAPGGATFRLRWNPSPNVPGHCAHRQQPVTKGGANTGQSPFLRVRLTLLPGVVVCPRAGSDRRRRAPPHRALCARLAEGDGEACEIHLVRAATHSWT